MIAAVPLDLILILNDLGARHSTLVFGSFAVHKIFGKLLQTVIVCDGCRMANYIILD